MRGRRSIGYVAGLVLIAILAVPGRAGAQADNTAPDRQAPEAAGDAATRHFKLGVKLYQDGNFAGALAEFEATYRDKPGASSLQNIALCLKQLFRYSEAADTLEKLLKQHGAELSEDQKKSVQSAVDELSALVGSITISVVPADARVSVDGKPVDVAARAGAIRLNVGEHSVAAEAPGYQRVAKTIRVTGGQTRVPVDLSLAPITGFVTVEVDDKDAAIAIDGKALGFHSWRGPLEPGRHYVQVYKQGYKTYEQVLNIQLGETENVVASLRPLPPGETNKADDAPPRQLRGWYGLAVLDLLGLDGAPSGIKQGGVQEQRGGVVAGVRAGYRLWTPVGVELMLEGGRHQVKDACVTEKSHECGDNITRSYTLSSFRLGPALRIMSGGEKVRFTSTIGAGAVQHELVYDKPKQNGSSDVTAHPDLVGLYQDATARGWDPFFMLEVGAQFNWGHVLLEANVTAYLDGASNVHGDTLTDPYNSVSTGGLKMIGLGLRAGWGEWTPDDAPKHR